MQFALQLIVVVAVFAALFTLYYLSFTYVPRIYRAYKKRQWDRWCKKNHYHSGLAGVMAARGHFPRQPQSQTYIDGLTGDTEYWKNFFRKLGD